MKRFSSVAFVLALVTLLFGFYKLLSFYFFLDRSNMDGFGELALFLEWFLPLIIGLFLLGLGTVLRRAS